MAATVAPATSPSRTTDPVPLVPTLEHIYSSGRLVKEGSRWDRLVSNFSQHFPGTSPNFVARAPGRVNIIGEHIDHMGFSVLPAALEMDILMAVHVERAPPGQSASDTIHFELHNTTARFEPTRFTTKVADPSQVELQHEGGARWANYFKVAFKGLHPHLPASVLSSPSRPSKVSVLVDGTIPPESSLSSSAAMTSCSSIVVLEAFGARELISRREMAEVAIESERLVGVASGGMDQAASIFGLSDHALHISFFPTLTVQPIKLPASDPPHTFVVANTLVVSDKKVMGPVQYNLRVCELRMAARALCRSLELPTDASTQTLKRLMETYFAKNPLPPFSNEADKEVAEARRRYGDEAAKIKLLGRKADEILPKQALSRKEVEKLTGYEDGAFEKEFMNEFPVRADTFKLHARTKHVFAEAFRVLEFRGICNEATSGAAADRHGAETYQKLGALLDDSQESLMRDYENGCPELLEVVELARKAGSLGSRATGAGWGGSTVHLVPSSKVDSVRKALIDGYYKKRFPQMSDEAISDAILTSQPAGGACVYKLDATAASATASAAAGGGGAVAGAGGSGREGSGARPLDAVKKAMGTIAPLSLADTSWDNVGVLVEAPHDRKGANKVMLAIDLTTAVADEILADAAVGVAIVYHPIIFRGLKSLTLADPQQRSILRLIAAGVSVYTPHTSLDAAVGGINDWLAVGVAGGNPRLYQGSYLGVPVAGGAGTSSCTDASAPTLDAKSFAQAIVPEKAPPRGQEGAGMGRLVDLSLVGQAEGITLHELAARVKELTGCRTVQVAKPDTWDRDARIRTVAVCAGSGGSVFRGCNADAYVTGELSHHEVLAYTARNRAVVVTNHSNTERGYLADVLRPRLASLLASQRTASGGGSGQGGEPGGSLEVVVSKADHDPLQPFLVEA